MKRETSVTKSEGAAPKWDGTLGCFAEIVAKAIADGHRDALATAFDVSPSMVDRWASRAARPHPIIQGRIVEECVRVAKSDFLDEIIADRTAANPEFPSLVAEAKRRREAVDALGPAGEGEAQVTDEARPPPGGIEESNEATWITLGDGEVWEVLSSDETVLLVIPGGGAHELDPADCERLAMTLLQRAFQTRLRSRETLKGEIDEPTSE